VRLPKLGWILSAEGDLQPLVAKTRDLRTLAGLVEVFLPPDLARQGRVANFREGELVLVAANAAAAAKFRLLAPALSRFLLERRWQVNSVSVRVQPNAPGAAGGASHKSVHLSANTLGSLKILHDEMQPSPAKVALARLLSRRGARLPEEPPPQKTAPARSRKARP
jgi:hypothetical protein